MLNLNLLPPAEKLVVAYELRTRAVVTIASAFVAVFMVVIVLLLPSLFFLSFQKADVVRLLELDSEIQARTGVVERIEETKRLNRIAQAVVEHERNRPELFLLFAAILSAVPPGVSLSAVEYRGQSGELDLVGFAPNRERLLSFLRVLQANPRLEEVSSPVANLIRETDISFSISAKVK